MDEGLYTKSEIIEVPTGWDIEIMDPEGTIIARCVYVMTKGEKFRAHVDECLNIEADVLLSHLNRHVYSS